MSRFKRWGKRAAKIGGGLVGAILVLWLAMLLLMWHWLAEPPKLAGEEPELTRLQPVQEGSRIRLGRNWLDRREGLPVLYVTGSAFEMGYANGALTAPLIHRQENVLLGQLERVAPYGWTRFLLKFIVVWKNRDLPEFVSPELQLEIYGVSRGCPDGHPEQGPWYHRLLNYHAAQDISYMLMNSPLIRGGCTAFGAWGAETASGHLLAGRNFDWEAASVFDDDRILILYEPDDGIPFVSLSWAGMVGCVSGMNRAGLAVTVNGAPSNLPSSAATPTCLVAREVLQHASNIEQATRIIRDSSVFVSAMFLVGSREDGRFVVVEKTPDQTHIRAPGDQEFIVCANHYMTSALTNTEINRLYLESDTSLRRYNRMRELMVREQGALTPSNAASVLRDRRLVGDRWVGNGHRSALNPLIATHAVIMDLTDGVFWAGTPPHQLGPFVAFRLEDWDRELPDLTIAADPMLDNGEYERFLEAERALGKGRRLLRDGDLNGAWECALVAETNNPGFYRNAWLRAEILLSEGRLTEAAGACESAVRGSPALGAERKHLSDLTMTIQDAQSDP